MLIALNVFVLWSLKRRRDKRGEEHAAEPDVTDAKAPTVTSDEMGATYDQKKVSDMSQQKRPEMLSDHGRSEISAEQRHEMLSDHGRSELSRFPDLRGRQELP